MSGFAGYAVASLAVLAVLGEVTRHLGNSGLRTACWLAAATSPMWVGLAGLLVMPGGKFGEEWAWAWGLSHMAFLAPTLVSLGMVRALAGPIRLPDAATN